MKEKDKIYKFGENGKDKWYEINGKRIPCDESIIMTLWYDWSVKPSARREDDDNYSIFACDEPLTF